MPRACVGVRAAGVGEPAALVLLPASPLVEPGVWRTPSAVFADGRLTVSPNAPNHRAVRTAADQRNR